MDGCHLPRTVKIYRILFRLFVPFLPGGQTSSLRDGQSLQRSRVPQVAQRDAEIIERDEPGVSQCSPDGDTLLEERHGTLVTSQGDLDLAEIFQSYRHTSDVPEGSSTADACRSMECCSVRLRCAIPRSTIFLPIRFSSTIL